jgi:TRAP-type C4-dicarboxylate transport system permease small subunit
LNGSHATVDLFTNFARIEINRVLLAVWEVLAALVFILIAWRLAEGMLQKLDNGETTQLLQFPIWWVYAACIVPAVVATIVSLWSAWDRTRSVVTGRDTRAVLGGSSH